MISVSSKTAGRRALALVAIALAATIHGGCDVHSDGTSHAGASVQNSTSSNRGLGFLDRMPTAPMTVSYGGRRHVKINYWSEGLPAKLEYEEQVWSDGQGRFSIVPGKVSDPRLTQEQLELFRTLQQARDGFFYRYRDFRIRDLQVFLQNWRATDTGVQEIVAGVPTSVIEFRRIDGSPTWYRACIDPQTALVMRAEEFSAGNRLASSMEFETFQLSPDTTGMGLEDDRFVRTPFDPHTDTTQALGFRVRPPSILPDGYRLERAESTSDGTNTWAILTYTDGVDSLFFLQTLDPQGQAGQPPTGEADVGPKVVRGYHFGPWTVLQVRSDRDRVLVLGKADSSDVERMLKSSLH